MIWVDGIYKRNYQILEENHSRPVPDEIKKAWRKLAPLLSAQEARTLVLRGWDKTLFHPPGDPNPDPEGAKLADHVERMAEDAP